MQRFMSCLHKKKTGILTFNIPHLFLFVYKDSFIKMFSSFNTYKHIKFHGPTLSSANFVSTSEV
jgi:hypothetical protein